MPFDFHEIVARPLLICAATRDSDFDVGDVRDCVAAARSVYALFCLPDLLVADDPDSPHDFPPEARRRAYEFLERHL